MVLNWFVFTIAVVTWIAVPIKSVFANVPATTTAPGLTVFEAGWMDRSTAYPTIHLSGTETEMGEQYGYLAGDLIRDNLENLNQIAKAKDPKLFKWIPKPVFTVLRRTVGYLFWNHFSKGIKEHIRGIVSGAKKRPDRIRLNHLDLAFLNSVIDLTGITDAISEKIALLKAKIKGSKDAKKEKVNLRDLFNILSVPHFTNQCDTFAAWGSRTVDGKTFQSRNTDLDTGEGLEKFPVTLVLKKKGKIPVVLTSFAGMSGAVAGMNAAGVAMGQVWGFSYDIKISNPWGLEVRDLFMEYQTAKQVADAWKKIGHTAYGTNFIFADSGESSRDQNVAFAVEASAKGVAVFHGNDPKENDALVNGQAYSIPLKDAIARADFFMDQKLRSRSYGARGPSGDPRVSGSYRLRYLGQIERILDYEKAGVKIGQPEAEAISRETASKDGNLQNSVYANTDREMWVAVAKVFPDGSVKQAYEMPYVHIPFSKFLIQARSSQDGISFRRWAKNAPSQIEIKVTRSGKPHFQASVDLQKLAGLSIPFIAEAGDIMEVFDYSSGERLDRSTVR